MTIIPKKIQFAFIAVFTLLLVWVFFNFFRLSYNPSDLGSIEDINRIYVERNGVETEISKPRWPQILEAIERASREVSSGYKGETWKYYCNLVIDIKSDYSYVMQLAQRKPHGNVIPVHYLRGSVSSHWSYEFYDGSKLVETINSVVTPNKARQGERQSYVCF